MPRLERTQLSSHAQPTSGYRLQAEASDNRSAGFELEPGTTYTLTRDAQPQCSNTVPTLAVSFGLSAISAEHCTIRIEDGDVIVTDLASTNGTFQADRQTPIIGETRIPIPAVIHLAVDCVTITIAKPGPTSQATSPAATSVELDLSLIAEGGSFNVGRDESCDLALDHPSVSRLHCTITRTGDQLTITDHNSLNGTFLDGELVTGTQPIPDECTLTIGPFSLTWLHNRLFAESPPGLAVTVRHLDYSVAGERGRTKLLDDVHFTIEPGSFIAIIGPSGVGKSTLLQCLHGAQRDPADRGGVIIAGHAIPEERRAVQHLVGYVPQEEIVHRQLTVAQALDFTLQLRAPDAMSRTERRRRIAQTLSALDLADRKRVRISRLSGGERRRVSLAAELLAQPKLLLLDEITAGLDARVERLLMQRFRALADSGITVVCITHHVENIRLCDRVAVLGFNRAAGKRTHPPGSLAYFGPPEACPAFFGASDFSHIYDRLDERDASAWRNEATDIPTDTLLDPQHSQHRAVRLRPPSAVRQLAALAGRSLVILRADRRGSAFLVGQPLAIGLILCLAFHGMDPRHFGPGSAVWKLAFFIAVCAVWFSTNNASREIAAESAILRRERLAGLRLWPYLLSKGIPLAVIGSVQMMLLLAVLWVGLGGAHLAPFAGMLPMPELAVVCIAAVAAGTASGLSLSALVRSPAQATFLLPYIIIPQVILGGAMVPTVLDGTWSGAARTAVGAAVPINWTYRAVRTMETDAPNFAIPPVDPALSGGDHHVYLAVHENNMWWYRDGRSFSGVAFWIEPAILLSITAALLLFTWQVLIRRRC
ncbi:MAG: ATP-binding cassette domain-containing protein [Phycisphaerales bacterium]|nr:ATP-binding cassette domain-containing protein [Phycisphaerales bacterium]